MTFPKSKTIFLYFMTNSLSIDAYFIILRRKDRFK
jgi:hypothetical protein